MVARILLTILLCLMALPAWATDPLMDWESGELATFVRSGTATYIDSDGVLQTAAENEPRLQHVPDLGLALLLEGAATNKLKYSDLKADGRSSESIYVNYDALRVGDTIGPDGASTSGTLFEFDGSGNSLGYYRVESNTPVDGSLTVSLWAKSLDVTQINEINLFGAVFTLTDEWQRYSVTYAYGETVQDQNWIKCFYNSTSPVDGSQVALAFGQSEELPFATSYIPTTPSATASRATEAADAAGNGFAFALADNPALAAIFEGSGRMEFTFVPGHDLSDTTGTPGLISVADGADLVFIDGSGVACSDGTTNATKAVSYEAGTAYDISVRWGGGKMAVAVDGTEGVEQDFDSSFGAGTHLRLGWANPYPWQIRGLAFYDASTGGERVAYWPLNGTEYAETGDAAETGVLDNVLNTVGPMSDDGPMN